MQQLHGVELRKEKKRGKEKGMKGQKEEDDLHVSTSVPSWE